MFFEQGLDGEFNRLFDLCFAAGCGTADGAGGAQEADKEWQYQRAESDRAFGHFVIITRELSIRAICRKRVGMKRSLKSG